MMSCRTCALLLLLSFLWQTRGSAQEVRGTVSDLATDQPIASALILLVNDEGEVTRVTTSDSSGAFRLPAPGQDNVRVLVQRVGYRAVESISLAVDGARPLQLEIRLRQGPVQLEGLTVTAPTNDNLAGFLKRKRTGFGHYLGPEEIEKIDPKTTSGLLFAMPGSGVRWSRSGRAIVADSGGHSCVPAVFLDGRRLEPVGASMASRGQMSDGGILLDPFVPASALRAVEVYRNPANAPGEFQRARPAGCSVIVLWTNFGFRDFN